VRLSLYEFTTGAETAGGQRVVYDVANDIAHFGAAEVEGHALVWQLDATEEDAEGALLSRPVPFDPFADWVLRCDRVDFPPGGVAYRHVHPGPGIRYLLEGRLDVHTEGRMSSYGPGGTWFEAGPEPVLAEASQHHATAFVRVLLLPAEWVGKRTIRYVDTADEDRPKLQTARVYLEQPLKLHA
jgi:quercetin dioxygenase-like cupin family protein